MKRHFADSTARHHEKEALLQSTPYTFQAAGWEGTLTHGLLVWDLDLRFTGVKRQRLHMRHAAFDIIAAFTRAARQFHVTPIPGGQKVTWERTDLRVHEINLMADTIAKDAYQEAP